MTVLGTKVRVHPLWALVLVAGLAAGYLPEVVLAVSVLFVHELAHFVVAKAVLRPIETVTLYPFGGVAEGTASFGDPHADALIALAGPLAGFFAAGAGYAALRMPAALSLVDPDRLALWVDMNLAMSWFNCLPVLPLDGGQTLRTLLARRQGEAEALRMLRTWSRPTAAAVAAFGTAGLVMGQATGEFVLLGGFLWIAGTGEASRQLAWAWAGSAARRASLQRRGVVEGRTLVTRADTRLGEVARAATPGRYHVIVVVDGPEERLIGMIGEAALERALARHGPAAPIRTAMGA